MKLYNFTTTIRNARKNGVLTFSKLFGLSIAFAVILFAVGYVYYETSFDKSIPGHDRIYRCLMQGQLNKEVVDYAVTSPAEAAGIKNEIPEITETLRILYLGHTSLKYENKDFDGGILYYADPDIFSFFSIPVKTNIEDPLAADNNLAIAKSVAEKQFGSAENALGKVVEVRGEDCIITGVFDDLPDNFHLRIKMIQPLQKLNPDNNEWGSQSYFTYFKTNRSNVDVDALNFKISKCVLSHTDDRVDLTKAKTMADLKPPGNVYLLYTCEHMTDIHFSSHKFDPAITANKMYVYGAIILAILVLLISSVNFINLTVASISTRLKEVGIRKTIGAYKKDIVVQFIVETAVFFIVSFLLAVVIYLTAGKSLAQYTGFDISLSHSLVLKIVLAVFVALTIFLFTTNIFPAILTSNKKVLSLIRNERTGKTNPWGRNSLTLVQFIISGLIILGAVIVQKQISFMLHKNLGYDAENVMMFSLSGIKPESRGSFIKKLKTYSTVKTVATSGIYFGKDFGMNAAYFDTGEEQNYFHTSILPADDNFMNTFNFKLKEGRFFEHENKSDFDAIVLNESAVNEYPGEGSLIGKNVIINNKTYRVIGIVKDFNFRSLRHAVEPLVITRAENMAIVYVKIRNNAIPEAISIIQKLWKEFNIGFPLSYQFHDEVLAQHYLKDQQARKLLFLLSVLSMVIACVGLYAVSFFTIVRKTKEIGIRKVNGAKVSEVMAMLNKDFVKWVAIAFVISCPVAWYAMHKWLENFAYKTTLSWWIFALAGILALGIALLTVSWQSWRAATKNPVEALRYE